MTEITNKTINALQPGEQINCSSLRGFRVRCLPSGLKKMGYRYSHAGKQHEVNLGLFGSVTLAAAKTRAMEVAAQAVAGIDPLAKARIEQARASNTLNAVLDSWLRDARKRGLKTVDTVERIFNRLIRPELGALVIYDLRRSQVATLLEEISDEAGPAMAYAAHGWLRTALRWQRRRDDEFNNDPVPGGISPPQPRERALTDEEVRDVWLACDEVGGVLPALVRMLLLTGCRRGEVAGLQAEEIKHDDLRGDYIEIPAERMKKGKAHLIPITAAIAALLPAGKTGLLFTAATTDTVRPGPAHETLFNGFGYAKRVLDAAIARRRQAEGRKAMPEWCLHDLRRTVRSGMPALGVAEVVAERILAHDQRGIERHYNKYGYFPEKRAALELWAGHAERVVHGSSNVVVALPAAGGRVGGLGGR